MLDYIIYFRSFQGPGYWGSFKHTKAYNDQHAQQKLERITTAFFKARPEVIGKGEFRIDQESGDMLKIRLQGLSGWHGWRRKR